MASLDVGSALVLTAVTGCPQRQAKVGVHLAKLLGQDPAKRLQPLRLGLEQLPLALRLVPGTPDLLAGLGSLRLGITLRIGEDRLGRLGRLRLHPHPRGFSLAQPLAGLPLERTRLFLGRLEPLSRLSLGRIDDQARLLLSLTDQAFSYRSGLLEDLGRSRPQTEERGRRLVADRQGAAPSAWRNLCSTSRRCLRSISSCPASSPKRVSTC